MHISSLHHKGAFVKDCGPKDGNVDILKIYVFLNQTRRWQLDVPARQNSTFYKLLKNDWRHTITYDSYIQP